MKRKLLHIIDRANNQKISYLLTYGNIICKIKKFNNHKLIVFPECNELINGIKLMRIFPLLIDENIKQNVFTIKVGKLDEFEDYLIKSIQCAKLTEDLKR